MRPLSSPCWAGFVVFGRLTSGPLRISGAITMKMISSTSTTSTSGVMLMAACLLAGSPSRIGMSSLDRHLHFVLDLDVQHLGFGYLEQAVHELGRSPVHLDVECLDLAGEVVEGDDGRDSDENTQGRRNKGFGDTARDNRHSAGPGGRNISKSVNDSDYGAEKTYERRSRTDRSQEAETSL